MTEVSDVIPDWFEQALRAPCDDRTLRVGDCPIHYLGWGDPALPRLVLLHGGAAHAHWWSFLAPMLADQHRVLAPDLRGMGDSGHCPAYLPDDFARDVLEMCRHDGDDQRLIVIGHSFGGYVALKTALTYPGHILGMAVVDTPIRAPEDPRNLNPEDAPVGRRKIYTDFQEAVSRFRLLPAQPCENRFIMDYCTRHALERTPGGWTWKFDKEFFRNLRVEHLAPAIPTLRCRRGVIYGELSSLMTPDVLHYMRSRFGPDAEFIGIPDAYHHVMIDQPLVLAHELRRLTQAWRGWSESPMDPPRAGIDEG